MTLINWGLYGLLTTLVIYISFPIQTAGSFTFVIFMSLFIIIGGFDYFTSWFVNHTKKLD